MRKSKNYYKFMEYMAFGISGWHENAVMVDNGVIECVAYAKVEHIEDYSKLYECNYDKMAMDSDNTWLTIKCEEATGYHESRRYNKSRVGK